MEEDPSSDAVTNIVRFICGFIVFGLVSLCLIGALFTSLPGSTLVVLAIVIGTVSGLFAVIYGDSFWLKMKDLL